MNGERKESDQLPEEAPAEQVTDDTGDDDERGGAEKSPGVPGEEKRGTGQSQDHD